MEMIYSNEYVGKEGYKRCQICYVIIGVPDLGRGCMHEWSYCDCYFLLPLQNQDYGLSDRQERFLMSRC